MKKVLLVLVAAGAVIAGCGGGLKDKVVGTWKYAPKSLKVEGVTDAQLAGAEAGFGSARFEFKQDGTYSVGGMGGKAETGKWSLDGKNLTMTEEKPSSDKPTLTVNDDASKIHVHLNFMGKGMDFDLMKA